MGKRGSTRSAESAVNAMVNAGKPPPSPPAHVRLDARHMPFWDGILKARSRDEWGEVDLVVAAQLSRCQFDIEAESLELEKEGTIVKNQRGTQIPNPRVGVLELLARREMALMRALQLAGRAAGDPRHQAGRRKLERTAADVRKELEEQEEEDGLLAG